MNLPEDADLPVTNLFGDLRDGWIFCKIADFMKPGCIDWSICKHPCNRIEATTGNITEFLKAMKRNEEDKGFNMTNFGSVGQNDIYDGQRIKSTVWNLCLYYYSNIIGHCTDKEIVAWANNEVGGNSTHIKNLGDGILKDGRFFLELLKKVEPRAIDDEIIRTDVDEEEARANNAKYALSCMK